MPRTLLASLALIILSATVFAHAGTVPTHLGVDTANAGRLFSGIQQRGQGTPHVAA